MSNAPITDEQLSLLIDERLAPDEADALRARIRTEPDLAERFAARVDADAQFRARLRDIDAEPLPDAVVALLAPRSATVTPLPGRRQARERRLPLLAAAAGVVLAVAATLLVWRGGEPPADGALPDLATALSTAPRGAQVTLDTGARVLIMASYAADAQFCRKYRVEASAAVTESLACLEGGVWNVHATDARFDPDAPYRTAIDGPAAGVDAVVAERGLIELGPAEEARHLGPRHPGQ